MSTLLKINTSIFSDKGESSQLADQYVAAWQAKNPDGKVVSRDLASDPIPHLDAARFLAFVAAPEERTAAQQAVVAFSDALIAELKAADEVVIGLPLYNFGVPSTFKAYFDHVSRAGVTFSFTEAGPVGLLDDKKVIVFATRGGYYANTPKDTQTAFVKNFFSLIGITQVEFIYAEGLNVGDAAKAAALSSAQEKLAQRIAA